MLDFQRSYKRNWSSGAAGGPVDGPVGLPVGLPGGLAGPGAVVAALDKIAIAARDHPIPRRAGTT